MGAGRRATDGARGKVTECEWLLKLGEHAVPGKARTCLDAAVMEIDKFQCSVPGTTSRLTLNIRILALLDWLVPCSLAIGGTSCLHGRNSPQATAGCHKELALHQHVNWCTG